MTQQRPDQRADRAADASGDDAEATLAFLERHGVPPDPDSFLLWRDYLGGADPDLEREVTARRAGGAVIGPAMSRDLQRWRRNEGLRGRAEAARAAAERAAGAALRGAMGMQREAATYCADLAAFRAAAIGAEDQAEAAAAALQGSARAQARASSLERNLVTLATKFAGAGRLLATTDQTTAQARQTLSIAQAEPLLAAMRDDATPTAVAALAIKDFAALAVRYGGKFGEALSKLVIDELARGLQPADCLIDLEPGCWALLFSSATVAQAESRTATLAEALVGRTVIDRRSGVDLRLETEWAAFALDRLDHAGGLAPAARQALDARRAALSEV